MNTRDKFYETDITEMFKVISVKCQSTIKVSFQSFSKLLKKLDDEKISDFDHEVKDQKRIN